MSKDDPVSLEELVRSAMHGFGLDAKKIKLRLHISKGADSLDYTLTQPEYLFLPGGTYILNLEDVGLILSDRKVKFEFVNVSFELKGSQVVVLSTETGLQDIEVGVTREIAESRDLKASQIAVKAIQKVIGLLVVSKEVREKLLKIAKYLVKK